MKGPTWYLNRLRCMSLAEVAYRVVQRAAMYWESVRPVPPAPAPQPQAASVRWVGGAESSLAVTSFVDVAAYAAAAGRVLDGRFDVFAMHDVALGFPPNWLRDCRTGQVAPLAFGKTLNYRDEALVGDIKYLWEPSRHLELVTLAQAWHLTGEIRYANGARALVQSWIEQNPYPLGPHWTSSLEHGVRLVNWAVAWQLMVGAPLFDGAQGKHFRAQWLESVFRHCDFIAGHLSGHSSANNHLLGELLGLLVGALTWPCWPQSERWAMLAQTGFEEQALLQNAPDGVNREQAFWYHHEVAEMMLIAGLALRATGRDFGTPYWQRLESMLGFIASVMDICGNVPAVGDSDDAVMLRLTPEPGFNVFRSLLASGAVIFARPDFARMARQFDDKSCWLLGCSAAREFQRLTGMAACAGGGPQFFAESGYCVMGHHFGEPLEVKLVADAGPLGYLSIAAHGHADALAFTLSAAGNEVLIDPGTYVYQTNNRWRDYFRGTSAHNTVRVDGADQSVPGGSFIWLHHAKARCESFASDDYEDLFSASHDGYQRLADPVTHWRQIVFNKVAQRVTVTDILHCAKSHQVEVFWHFAEDFRVNIAGGHVYAENGRVAVLMTVDGAGLQPVVVCGQEDPPLGWVSRNFDEKQRCPTVLWAGVVDPQRPWTTVIQLELRAPVASAAYQVPVTADAP